VDAGPIKIILSPENWETKRQDGEELVIVQVSPRVSIKMRKSEAIAKGLYVEESTAKGAEGAKKSRKPGRNKMRVPAEDK